MADHLDAGTLGSAEGVALAGAVDAAQATIQAGWLAEDAAAVASALAGLTPTIDAYFTATMINDPDAAVRAQRLGVARRAAACAQQIADFRQLVG
jgi:glycyl-tRNA synthetase beta chain